VDLYPLSFRNRLWFLYKKVVNNFNSSSKLVKTPFISDKLFRTPVLEVMTDLSVLIFKSGQGTALFRGRDVNFHVWTRNSFIQGSRNRFTWFRGLMNL